MHRNLKSGQGASPKSMLHLYLSLNTGRKIILAIQSFGMLLGTSTHVAWIWNHGFLSDDYGVPLPSKIFWDLLTVLDPLAAVLLILRPKTGVLLTAGIIAIDVIHNNMAHADELYGTALELNDWLARYWMIAGQIVFLLFVLITFRGNMQAIKDAKVAVD